MQNLYTTTDQNIKGVRTSFRPGAHGGGGGGVTCFLCQKLHWCFLKEECFYFMKTHFIQKYDGAETPY